MIAFFSHRPSITASGDVPEGVAVIVVPEAPRPMTREERERHESLFYTSPDVDLLMLVGPTATVKEYSHARR